MITTELYLPNGTVVPNPDQDYLNKIILTEGTDFWNSGSGEAALDFNSETNRTCLSLVFQESQGFFLTHIALSDGTRHVVKGNDLVNKVDVYIGGNKLSVPASLFVPRDLALTVINHFTQTGLPFDSLTWIDERTIHWDDPE